MALSCCLCALATAVQQSVAVGLQGVCVCVDLLSQGFGTVIGVIVHHTFVHVVGIRREGEGEKGGAG